jgi:hypothetical protein
LSLVKIDLLIYLFYDIVYLSMAKPSSIESGAPRLDQAQEEQLLSGVQPDIIEVLGRDMVIPVEAALQNLTWSNNIVKSANPFEVHRPGPPDLSFMKPDKAQRVLEAFESDDLPKNALKKLSTAPFRRVQATVKANRLLNLGSDAEEACAERIKQIARSIDQKYKETEQLVQSVDNRMAVEQVIELSEQMDAMHEYASQLPNEATFLAIKSTFEVSKTIVKAALAYATPLSVKLHARPLEDVDREMKILDAATKFADAVAKVGGANYDLQRLHMRDEEVWFIIDLLERVADAKVYLEDTLGAQHQDLDEEKQRAVLAAEEYLISRAAEAEETMRDIKPRSLKNKALQRALEQLQSPSINKASQERQAEHEHNLSRDLSSRVSEARDILKGGGRLRGRNGDNPQVLATSLRALSKEMDEAGQRSIEQEDGGVIISIITGRFDAFIKTLAEVQSEEVSDALAVVQRDRQSVVDELRRFDLEVSMQSLRTIVETPTLLDSLRSVLSDEQFIKLELGIDKYFEAQENQQRQQTDASLDNPFDEAELYARLDWTVLPRGEVELEKAAQEIVAMAQERAKHSRDVQIDLDRLNTLKNIKDSWGADRCYYARGTLSGRGKTTVEGIEQPDEYIVLVLQDLDSDGVVASEHAVAESPIAGHNAMYVMRGDVSEFSWRDVYSMPKKDARALGARPVKHTKGDGSGLVNVMTRKVNYLLSCAPEEFSAIQFNGSYIRVVKQLGRLSTSA